ncbi:MAG: carboxypeptidase regulatory-like domain-containing protein [bacterium]
MNKYLILATLFALLFLGVPFDQAQAQNTSIQGILTTPDGTAVSSAYIYIHDLNWSVSQNYYTNSDGSFYFYDLPNKTYTLEVYAYNSTYSDPDPFEVIVANGNTTDLGNVELVTPNVTGTLLQPDNSPISGMYIYIHNSNWSVSRSSYTNSDGEFGFNISASGNYTVELWSSYNDYWPPEPFTVAITGSTDNDLGEIFFKEPNISGTITEPDNITPVENINVTIRNSNWSISKYTSTDSNGEYNTYIGTPGTYIVELYCWDCSYPVPDNSQFTLVQGVNSVVNLSLVEPNLNGKVTLPDGITAVTSGSVSLHNNSWSFYRSDSIDTDGTFNFNVSSSGTYTIEIWTYDNASYSNPAPITFAYTEGDTIYYDGTNGSEVIKLRTPSMQGRVLMPDGSGASYASLNLHDSSYSYQGSAWSSTDMDGYFTMSAVSTGTYTLEITPSWNQNAVVSPDPISISLTEGTTNTAYLSSPISLERANKTISGYVVRQDGTRVTDAYISAYQRNGNGWASTTASSSGVFELLVGRGDWYVSVWPNTWPADWGYYESPTKVLFEESNNVVESTTVNFEVLGFTSTLSGRVLYPDGSVPPTFDYVSASAWGQDNGGNWANANSQGYFSMDLPPGTFNLEIYSSNNSYGAPNRSTITLLDGETKNIGTVYFVEKNEFIKGTVRDSNGNPLENQSINAWKETGSGWDWQTTDSNGDFTLSVTPGRWNVHAYPAWGYDDDSITYVATQEPVTVVLEANQTVNDTDFVFAIADATIQGTLQDADGNVLDDIFGWVYASRANQTRGSEGYWYSDLGGSIDRGTFTLKIPAGTWDLGAYLGWSNDYTAASSTSVVIESGETVDDAIITVLPNDATITGTFYDEDGELATDIWGSVFAENGIGGYQWSNINDGIYELHVAAGTWRVGYWVDHTSGYQDHPPKDNKITIASEEAKVFNINLQKLDSVIAGTALKPDGTPMANAWISADTSFAGQSSNDTGFYDWWNNQGRITDNDGKFSIQVTAGSYFVTGSLPPDQGYINPEKQKVTVDADNSADLILQFRESDAQISGEVTLDGTANEATIWGWSEKGGYTETYTSDGDYSLNATTNDNWHIGAYYETSSTFYQSSVHIVEMGDNSTATQNIVLIESTQTIPAPITTTFSTANTKNITLDDGTNITMPAYSISSTEVNVTVTASPRALPDHGTANVLGIGYDLEARYASGDQSGQTITTFASDVTMCLPYTDDQLEEEGLTIDDLVPKYWDSTSGTYKDVKNAVVNEDDHMVCFTTDHFTSFAITSVPSIGSLSVVPIITLTSPEDNTVVNVKSVSVAGEVNDPEARVTITLNSGAVGTVAVDSSTGAFSQTVTDLEIGENIITVNASNNAGAEHVDRMIIYETGFPEEDLPPDSTESGIEKSLIVTPTTYGGPQVRVFDRLGNLQTSFFAYAPSLRGKISSLAMDLEADGSDEIITYPGAGMGPHIRVFDADGTLITQFFPYHASFRGGIEVQSADVTGDSIADLIVKPLTGGSPNIRVYSYNAETLEFELVDWFWGLNENFRDQTSLKIGDVTGDGQKDIVIAPMNNGGPNIRVYTYTSDTETFELVDWYWAYQEAYHGGVEIALADIDGNTGKEIITWPAHNAGPNIQAYAYNSTTEEFEKLTWYWGNHEKYTGGLNVKFADLNNDGQIDIITAPTNGAPNVRVSTYNSTTEAVELIDWFWAYQESYLGGVSLNIANLDKDDYPELITMPINGGGPNLRVYEYDSSTETMVLKDWIITHNESMRSEVAVKVADLDGDGDSEIVASPTAGGPNIRIFSWENDELVLLNWFWGFADNFQYGAKVDFGIIDSTYESLVTQTKSQIEGNIKVMLSRWTTGFGHFTGLTKLP